MRSPSDPALLMAAAHQHLQMRVPQLPLFNPLFLVVIVETWCEQARRWLFCTPACEHAADANFRFATTALQ